VAVAAVRIPSRHTRPRAALRDADDAQLVARVRAGDDVAFEAIYDRYSRSLLAFCRHMLGGREEAEDALQQSLACAYRTLRGGERDIALRPWLFTIARNRCLSTLRMRRETAVDIDETQSPPPSFDGLAAEVQRRAELRELVADLQAIPADQRAALVLFELGDHSHSEIAQVLDVRSEKVKALIFQAREALRRTREARETPCPEIREQVAVLTGRVPHRGMLRAHLDRCAPCTDFAAEVRRQRAALAVILPVAPTVGLKGSVLASVLGGGGAAAAGGAGGGAAAAGGLAAGGGGAAAAGGGAGGLAGGAIVAGGTSAGGLGSVGVGAGGVAAGLGHAGVSGVATGLAAAGAGAGAASGLAGLAAKGVVAKILTAVAVTAGAGASTTVHEPTSKAPARPAVVQAATPPIPAAAVPLAPAPVAPPATAAPAAAPPVSADPHPIQQTKDPEGAFDSGDHGLPAGTPGPPQVEAPLATAPATSTTPATTQAPAAETPATTTTTAPTTTAPSAPPSEAPPTATPPTAAPAQPNAPTDPAPAPPTAPTDPGAPPATQTPTDPAPTTDPGASEPPSTTAAPVAGAAATS
jgi:RNA polymerase sigma factor (sigma-70 family)